MASLFALLSQQTPNLQTRKGLIVLDLQNDFVLPGGKLPVNDTGFLTRITHLLPVFRDFGDIIWVRSEFEANRPVDGLDTPGDTVVIGSSPATSGEDSPFRSSGTAEDDDGSPVPTKRFKVALDLRSEDSTQCADTSKSTPQSSDDFTRPATGSQDEELFLSGTATREPCCIRGTHGAEYVDRIKPFIRQGKDLQVVKTHYSAFGATSLLLTLRSKLITDLYVCGAMTNLSVYATAMDAARYGITITLIEDCLGYRKKDRHDLAITQLRDLMSADAMTSTEAIATLRNPAEEDEASDEDDDSQSDESEKEDQAINKAQAPAPSHSTDALQVDSEESEDEMSLACVRGYGPLEQRMGLRSISNVGKYSLLSTASRQPRLSTTPSSRSQISNSKSEQCRQWRSFHQQSEDISQPKRQTRTSHHGKLEIDSQPNYKQPWLDLLGTKAHSHSTISSTTTTTRPRHRGLAALYAAAGLSPSEAMESPQVAGDKTVIERGREEEEMSRSKPLLGVDKEIESSGSRISCDLLPDDLAQTIFDELNGEVHWQTMCHQTGEVPRLVCCQGTIEGDGTMPVYRHPSDQTVPLNPWTPAVDRVRQAAEKVVGHPLNHALIQLYRGGNDYISEHSDKTLDIAAGSNIVNVSFGAQRTMRLRTKRVPGQHDGSSPTTRTTYRIPMPHNSMITMSLKTNAQYLHGINWDRRPAVELSEAEKAFGGQRISLTFRNIGTFLNSDSTKVWGQGAVSKVKTEARPVVNGDPAQSEKMVRAFGAENQASTIVWEEIYGSGFDVLHLK